MSNDFLYSEIAEALVGIRNRLDTLASITAENILIPGGPQEHYHQIVEEAYVALGLIETQVDELRAELEYQHRRLDDVRDAALKQETGQAEQQFNLFPPRTVHRASPAKAIEDTLRTIEAATQSEEEQE